MPSNDPDYGRKYYEKNKERIKAQQREYHAKHREHRNKYNREYNEKQGPINRNKSRKWIEQYKLDRGCVSCGVSGPAYMLDLHHVDPATKKFNLGSAVSRSINLLQAEAAKCVVLCANCHRKVTHGDLVLPQE